MHSLNEVDIKHINSLSDIQLSQLLHTLIELEAIKNNLEDWDRSVPFNITTADAGSDGRAVWNGTPPYTKWLKNKYTVFQNKATELYPGDCYEEVLEPQKPNTPRKLKAQVEKLVQKGGSYILFTNKPIVDEGKDKRVEQFRNAIKDAGHRNYSDIQILVYDSNSIKDWVNENIAAVTLVQEFNGISRPQAFDTCGRWETRSKAYETVYHTNDIIKDYLTQISSSIVVEKVIRVYGHSGLGKTRLVLEAFRDNGLRKTLVYYDLAGYQDISEIKRYIINHQDHQDGILVIDNCSFKNHIILSDIIKSSGFLKMISIGLDDSDSIEDAKIKLERKYQYEIVREIIKDKLGMSHDQQDIDYVTSLCEGYPWMAKRFAENIIKTGFNKFDSILPIDFIIKFLFGGENKDREYKIIRSCAVFSSFGFPDDQIRPILTSDQLDYLESQLNFIRENILDIAVSYEEFFEVCQKYRSEDIIERHGSYYIVKPNILAINLAADWLLKTPSSKILKILKTLKGNELGTRIAERLKDLDQLDKAHLIVAELWGPNGFFSTAEVLNTSWGSLLFRHVVEVNPIATAKALAKAFGNQSKDELLQIDAGRRNLVWALEKLCFRKETFETAAKVLYSFAVAENESWGNNSTNQFKQLFQVYLAGTEVDFNTRIDIINWGLEQADDDYTKIAISALGRGLVINHLSRMGGAERQGSGALLEDFKPKTWQEIYDYWDKIVTILVPLACSSNGYSLLAQEELANSIRTLITHGKVTLVGDSIRKVVLAKGNLWPSALNALKRVLGFEKDIPIEVESTINALIEELTPVDIESQLFLKVTKPEWDSYEKDEEGNYVDKPRLKAEAYAEELVSKELGWFQYLPKLLQGEQRQAFSFGKKLGELVIEKDQFILKALQVLKQIPKEEQNPNLIIGFLIGADDRKLFLSTIDFILEEIQLKQHAFSFTSACNPTYDDIEKLFQLINSGEFSITQFLNFQYGKPLEDLSNDEFKQLCQKISTYGLTGKWTALSLLYSYTTFSEEKWNVYKELIRNIISEDNMLMVKESVRVLDSYHWSEIIKRIINNTNDIDFAKIIANQIVEFSSKTHVNYNFDSEIKQLMTILIEQYFESTWEIIGNGIIHNYWTYFHLSYVIGSKNSWYNDGSTLFNDKSRNEVILNWCRENPEEAPIRIAKMMPLSILEDDKISWHPFAQKIIREFGNNKDVLNEISANMGTYSITGTAVPYYQKQKVLLEQLLDHELSSVREWARNMIDYTNNMIIRENMRDDEAFLK